MTCHPDARRGGRKDFERFAASTEARAMLIRKGKVGFVIPRRTGSCVPDRSGHGTVMIPGLVCVGEYVYLLSGCPAIHSIGMLIEGAVLWRKQVP